jgi:predicted dehydrogenase
MSQQVTRRKFLSSAAAVAGVAAGAKVFAAPAVLSEKSPNSKLGTVVIGVSGDTPEFRNQGQPAVAAACTERLIALCDVDDRQIADAKKFVGKLSPDTSLSSIGEFYDYRKMFDKIHKDIDAVFIATPDHHHAVASLIAMRLGKNVYCEKPMAHSIGEVRLMMETARKYKVVTQLGNHHHSSESVRRLCEYIWAGAIGNVTETHSWARTGRGGIGGRLPKKPVPASLHWDEWIGPAAYRDYHEELHPNLWRSWWEFGDGSVGDWGCHNLDGVFMALKLGAPASVEALEQIGGSRERYPLTNVLRWTFPARGDMPSVKVHWYDGFHAPLEILANLNQKSPVLPEGCEHNRPAIVDEIEKKYNRKLTDGGAIFVGDKGILVTGNYCESPRLVPEEKQKSFPPPAKTLPRVKKGLTHYTDFLRACKVGGTPPSSHFDYGGPLSEMVLLGCLAERAGVGKHVEWDAEKVEVTNLPELNSLVRREYRKGWELG